MKILGMPDLLCETARQSFDPLASLSTSVALTLVGRSSHASPENEHGNPKGLREKKEKEQAG